ncbi:MAG: ATP-binding protein [Spirochaetales bacterium]|nr:ATP-binding protein [Spirochaetales bacterium]
MLVESPQRQALIEDIRLLDRLTGSVLDQRRLAQPGALRRELVSLHPWLKTVIEPWTSRPLLNLETCLEGRNVTASIDPARWEQVVNNLLENTIKHKNSEIAEVVVTLFTPPACEEGVFVLEVADRGPGVPEEQLSQLGEPFFQVDQSRNQTAEGFGLGLSLVKGIIEAHEGGFTAKNLKPHGLSIVLRCPY